jgi:hypothetical protein
MIACPACNSDYVRYCCPCELEFWCRTCNRRWGPTVLDKLVMALGSKEERYT